MSFEATREKLRELRHESSTDSATVLALAKVIFASSLSKLGDEVWAFYEQVFIATLDFPTETDLRARCFKALSTQFKKSNRVAVLSAMELEAKSKWDEATSVYDKIIADDANHTLAQKRKIAIAIARSRTADAIEALNKYLKKFSYDTEAWLELVELYLKQRDYASAAFCLEELVLHNPHNHLYFTKYAEVLYTQNTGESLVLARRYFAQALQLNPSSARAAYGLYLSSLKTAPKVRGSGEDLGVDDLKEASEKVLLSLYKSKHGGASPEAVKTLEAMFAELATPSKAE